MEIGALEPYERALHGAHVLGLTASDGRVVELDVDQWLAGTAGADASVVERCTGTTLDVGCGPGRFVDELSRRGVDALGLDIAPAAVNLTRRRGGAALHRSVFDRLPGEGSWQTVLLMDGNIGIGGDPHRLLVRLRGVQSHDGRLIVETDADPAAFEQIRLRFTQDGAPVGPSFAWARIGRHALLTLSASAGYVELESWSELGRSFTVLGRERTSLIA